MTADLALPSNLTLINATPFSWQKILNESTQMVEWDNVFPQQVDPGQIVVVPMSFSGDNTSVAGDGTVQYTLADDDDDDTFDFSFIAAAEQDSPFSINFTHSSTLGNQQRSTVNLGWGANSSAGAPFVLSGLKDKKSFSSTNTPTDWMHQNLATIGCQPLRRLVMPGSHDSGMSKLTGGTFLSTEQNTLCQWVDVAGQLEAGFRYFDLRPVIAGGNFVMGHYSEILDQWVGGNGQDLASIINQVNDYLDHHNELVILDMSHMFNTDEDWRSLNNDEFNRLLKQLEGVKYRYSGPMGPKGGDLSSLPLNNFIRDGPSVIILNTESSVTMPKQPPAGIFPSSALRIYNSYANTPFPSLMRRDQLTKLSQQRKSRDDPMFLLSWTLTTIDNIRELATLAHTSMFDQSDTGLWQTVYKNRQKGSYPNILYIDGIGQKAPTPLENRNVAALAMAMNHVVLEGVACPA